MKRYLEVEIEKTISTTIYVSVDDTNSRFKDFFENKDSERPNYWPKIDSHLKLAKAVEKTVDPTCGWDEGWMPEDEDYNVMRIKEVPQEEAHEYVVFDSIAGEVEDPPNI